MWLRPLVCFFCFAQGNKLSKFESVCAFIGLKIISATLTSNRMNIGFGDLKQANVAEMKLHQPVDLYWFVYGLQIRLAQFDSGSRLQF